MRVKLLFVFAVAAFVFAGNAHADPIAGGNLVAVFTETGSFYQTGEFGETTLNLSQNYTVVHFFEYAGTPPSDFFSALAPIAFPAAETPVLLSDFANVEMGSEYFLIGGILGVGEIGEGSTIPDDSHLLLSASLDEGDVPQLTAFTQLGDNLEFHHQLVAGTLGITSGGPVQQMSGFEFWSRMLMGYTGDFGASTFFGLSTMGPNGPVETIDFDVFSSVENEELFGHTKPIFSGTAGFGNSTTTLTWTDASGNVYTQPIPEPGTIALVSGALGLFWMVRRRRRRAG